MAARARNLFEPACSIVDTARCAAEQELVRPREERFELRTGLRAPGGGAVELGEAIAVHASPRAGGAFGCERASAPESDARDLPNEPVAMTGNQATYHLDAGDGKLFRMETDFRCPPPKTVVP